MCHLSQSSPGLKKSIFIDRLNGVFFILIFFKGQSSFEVILKEECTQVTHTWDEMTFLKGQSFNRLF